MSLSNKEFEREIKRTLFEQLEYPYYVGYCVYDANNRRIGYISEVYLDVSTRIPKYIYISHLNDGGRNRSNYLYPVSEIARFDDYGVYINASIFELEEFEVYHPEDVLLWESGKLVSHREVFSEDDSEDRYEFNEMGLIA